LIIDYTSKMHRIGPIMYEVDYNGRTSYVSNYIRRMYSYSTRDCYVMPSATC